MSVSREFANGLPTPTATPTGVAHVNDARLTAAPPGLIEGPHPPDAPA